MAKMRDLPTTQVSLEYFKAPISYPFSNLSSPQPRTERGCAEKMSIQDSADAGKQYI